MLPKILPYVLLRAETLFRPYNSANVGGHASQRDTCHLGLLPFGEAWRSLSYSSEADVE